MPHVIVRFYTVPDVRSARYSAGWALLFIAILYTSAPALASFARYNLINSIHNHTVAEIRQLDWATKWENSGLLTFNDKNADGRIQLTDEIPIEVDLGFQGLQNQYENIHLPHKKPRGGELSEVQKQENRCLSRARVICENAFAGVKRYNAVSGVYRNRIVDE